MWWLEISLKKKELFWTAQLLVVFKKFHYISIYEYSDMLQTAVQWYNIMTYHQDIPYVYFIFFLWDLCLGWVTQRQLFLPACFLMAVLKHITKITKANVNLQCHTHGCLLDCFTVSLHSPNGRHLPAIRAVQGDCPIATKLGLCSSVVVPCQGWHRWLCRIWYHCHQCVYPY